MNKRVFSDMPAEELECACSLLCVVEIQYRLTFRRWSEEIGWAAGAGLWMARGHVETRIEEALLLIHTSRAVTRLDYIN